MVPYFQSCFCFCFCLVRWTKSRWTLSALQSWYTKGSVNIQTMTQTLHGTAIYADQLGGLGVNVSIYGIHGVSGLPINPLVLVRSVTNRFFSPAPISSSHGDQANPGDHSPPRTRFSTATMPPLPWSSGTMARMARAKFQEPQAPSISLAPAIGYRHYGTQKSTYAALFEFTTVSGLLSHRTLSEQNLQFVPPLCATRTAQ